MQNNKIVMITGRFNPLQNDEAYELEKVCKKYEKVIIVIRKPEKNMIVPFTDDEITCMIDLFLKKRSRNYEIINCDVNMKKIKTSNEMIEIDSANDKLISDMTHFGEWKQHVPDEIAKYLEKNDLIEPLRRRFGNYAFAYIK